MIELNFRTINNQTFHKGVSKLVNFTGFNPKQAYAIARMADKIGTHVNEARAAYTQLISKYAQRDESGKVVIAQIPPFFEMKADADIDTFQKEYEEFLDIKVSLDQWQKLPIDTLPTNIALSAEEIKAIEPLIDFEEPAHNENVIPIK